MVLRRFLRRDGRAGRVVQGPQIPEPEREERHEHEDQESAALSISFQRDALTFIPNFWYALIIPLKVHENEKIC